MDLAAIGPLLGSIKTATGIVRLILESGVSVEKAETKLQLANLISALADAKIEAADVQQAMLERDELIRDLRAAAKLRTDLVWRQPCYFLANAQGEEEPYCQTCHDSEGKLSRLHTDGQGYFQCRVCKQDFETTERSKTDYEKRMAENKSQDSGWMKF